MGITDAIRKAFARRRLDDVGYVGDPERRPEDHTPARILAEFERQLALGFPLGLYTRTDAPWMCAAIAAAADVRRPVAVQADTGPSASFRGPFAPDPGLVELCRAGRVSLFFHLPHLFDLWLPFDPSQAGREGEQVRVPMVRMYVEYLNALAAGFPEGPDCGVGFVVHSAGPRPPGHPAPDDRLEARFRGNLERLFDPFLGGLSRRGVRGRILVENLVGPLTGRAAPYSLAGCAGLVRGLDPSRYGLCWDSGHSWAAGEDLSPADIDPALVGLVHMNGGPAKAGFGCGKDLHGYSELRCAAARGTAYPWLADPALAGIPAVFERKLYSVMLKDSAWLAGERGPG